MPRGRCFASLLTLLLLTCPASGDEKPSAAPANPSWTRKIWESLAHEARRYGEDSAALLLEPASWDREDLQNAGAIGLVLGGLMVADREIEREARQTRSRFTDAVSRETTRLGGRDAVYVAAGLLIGGTVTRSATLREMGRDALEASLLTHLMTKYLLKPAFGRERPEDSGGGTAFHIFSHHDSFPSGHATQAFAVASVVSARSRGWVVPAVVYTAATVVAFDRVNDRAHFASDVFAGAVLGTVTGRFLVRRHRAEEPTPGSVTIEPTLVPGGVGLQIRF